ncbi:hypothetical protein CLOP_g15388, partial [Closterium sp. NIES-67]
LHQRHHAPAGSKSRDHLGCGKSDRDCHALDPSMSLAWHSRWCCHHLRAVYSDENLLPESWCESTPMSIDFGFVAS